MISDNQFREVDLCLIYCEHETKMLFRKRKLEIWGKEGDDKILYITRQLGRLIVLGN